MLKCLIWNKRLVHCVSFALIHALVTNLSFAALHCTASSWWLLLHLSYHHHRNSWLLSLYELPTQPALHVTARKSGLHFLSFTSDALKPVGSWRRLPWETSIFLALHCSVPCSALNRALTVLYQSTHTHINVCVCWTNKPLKNPVTDQGQKTLDCLKKKKKGSISALFFSQQQGPHVIYNRNNKTLQVGYLCLTTVLAPNRIQKVATVSIEKDSKEKKFQTTFSFLGAIKAQQGLCCLLRVTPSHWCSRYFFFSFYPDICCGSCGI